MYIYVVTNVQPLLSFKGHIQLITKVVLITMPVRCVYMLEDDSK